MTFKTPLLSSCFAALILSACSTGFLHSKPDMEKAEYWQRQSATSAIYMQGPKAQQILHQDIANCTVEIRELENLGEIRRAVPATYQSNNQLDEWNTPARDGYLYNEHLDYADFESCMIAKGWERAEYLPYSDADKARKDYLKSSERKDYGDDRENVTSLNPAKQNPPPYENLND